MDDPIVSKDPVEGITPYDGEALSLDLKDDELVKIINFDLNEQKSRYQELLNIAKKNEDYWRGKQIDSRQLSNGDSEVVINRMLVSIETMCSIITSTTPDPWVIVTPKDKEGRRLESKLRRKLRDNWEYELNMQQTMEKLLRNYYASRVGFLKYGFDSDNRIFTDLIRLENVRFDLDATSVDNSRFFIHFIKEPASLTIAKFPEKKEFIQRKLSEKQGSERADLTYIEYWGDYYDEEGKKHSYVCWKLDNEILGKDYNPNWNKSGKKYNNGNHFKFPRKPFIPMHSLSTGKSVVDDTSLNEQAIPIQDAINRRERQIDRNAWLANGIMVTHEKAMDETTFGKIDGTTQKVFLDGDIENIGSAFGVVTGRPFEGGIFNDLDQLKAEMDNIYGTHDTTRGEKSSSETLGGQALRRDADFGRLDLTSRSYEQVAEDVYNAWVQLMYVKDDENPILTEREQTEPMENYKIEQGLATSAERDEYVTKDELKEYVIKVIVKKGSTRPDDPVGMQDDAMKLMQTGMIDPMTFAEMYGLDDPRKIGRRMYMWVDPNLRSKLFPELSGGNNMIHPVAIEHIEGINRAADLPEDEQNKIVLGNVYQDFTDINDLSNHIETHRLYMQGAEVDEDLTAYSELDEEVQMLHKKHLKVELDALTIEQKAEAQKRQANSVGNVPPVSPEAAGVDQTQGMDQSQMMQGAPPQEGMTQDMGMPQQGMPDEAMMQQMMGQGQLPPQA